MAVYQKWQVFILLFLEREILKMLEQLKRHPVISVSCLSYNHINTVFESVVQAKRQYLGQSPNDRRWIISSNIVHTLN